MVKEILHNSIFLRSKSEVTAKENLQLAQYLVDTLVANKDGCVGMAVNMIDERKRITVFDNDSTHVTMFNLKTIRKSMQYNTGERFHFWIEDTHRCKRNRTIIVHRQTIEF